MRISDWSSDVCSSDLMRMLGQRQTMMKLSQRMESMSTIKRPQAPPRPPRHGIDGTGPGAAASVPPSGAEIGRASCRERVCPYLLISGVAVSLTKKHKYTTRKIPYEMSTFTGHK